MDLTRLLYQMEEDLISIVALKDHPELRIDGINIRLLKDQQSKIPYWIAKILEKEKLISIIYDDAISPHYIRQLAHQEGEKRSLNEINSLLYTRVRTEIDRLRNIGNANALRKLTSIEGSFNSILRLRFKKVLSLASLGQLDDHGRKILAAEELWLYQHLHEIFDIFTKNVGMSTNKLGE